jgi:N utilization substance protein A
MSSLQSFLTKSKVGSLEEFKKAGLDTAKSVLEQDVEDLIKRTDLEEETIIEVRNVLNAEFSE